MYVDVHNWFIIQTTEENKRQKNIFVTFFSPARFKFSWSVSAAKMKKGGKNELVMSNRIDFLLVGTGRM